MKYDFKSYNKLYSQNYYDNQKTSSYQAAKLILGDLYEIYKFKSVVDFGCGSGAWLKAAWELNNDIKLSGIDGKYVKDIIDFHKANYYYKNLEEKVEIEKHDLTISLETAEHLKPERAKSFIDDLCKSSDVILFSAAVDGHGGANHLNEQTQSYWIKLFQENNYFPFIFLDRKKYWFHPVFEQCPHYIAGSFLYIKKNTETFNLLEKFRVKEDFVVDIVHPNILKWRKDEYFGLKYNLRRTFAAFKRYFHRISQKN